MGILLGLFSGAGVIAIVIIMIELFVIIAVITAIFEMRKETRKIRILLEDHFEKRSETLEEIAYIRDMKKYDKYGFLPDIEDEDAISKTRKEEIMNDLFE